MDSLYFDFMKAYNAVSHAKLKAKLEKHFCIKGKLLLWISKWLRAFFLLYIDNIEDKLDEPEVSLRVENKDRREVRPGENGSENPTLISIFIDDTKTARSIRWDMKFNVDKCKVFHPGRTNSRFKYILYGHSLHTTMAEKDVGVILTPDLRPSKMVARAASIANQVLGARARAVTWRDKNTLIQIYKTYVRPKLEYCSQAWSPWTACDRELLEKVQRRVVGMVHPPTKRQELC